MVEKSFLRAAFRNGYNLVFLGGMGLLGLMNWSLLPVVVPVAAALEGIYLLTVPGARWFQRRVLLEEAIRRKSAQEASKARVVEDLGKGDQAVYNTLKALKQEIVDHCRQQGDVADLVLQELGRLDQLIDAYLKLGLIRIECERHLEGTNTKAIEDDLRKLNRELPDAPPKARASKQQNVEILERRIERLRLIHEYVEVVASQQKAIADAFRLLNDQILTLGFTAEEEAGLISTEINRLISGVGETEEAVKKISIDMSSVHRILGELSNSVTQT